MYANEPTGNNSAAAVAMQTKSAFRRFDLVSWLVLTVAYEVKKVGIQLGDLVVSHSYIGRSGVVKYGFGKTTPSGFERTGFPNIYLSKLRP